jgi:predicted double-glycine peptidase
MGFIITFLFAHAAMPFAQARGAAVAMEDSAQPQAKLPSKLIRVPLTRQGTDYTCGVAALQSVLGFYGEEYREDELSKRLHADPKDGTDCHRIERFCRSRGFSTQAKTGMTLDELRAANNQGRPVIVLLQAWSEHPTNYSSDWDDGHYVVAIGCDAHNIYFMDPSTLGHYAYVPKNEFLKRWHDTNGKEKLVHFGMSVWKSSAPKYNPDEAKKMD